MTNKHPSSTQLYSHKPKKGAKHARGGAVSLNNIGASSTTSTRPSVAPTPPPVSSVLPVKEPFYVRNRGVIGSLLIANVAVCSYLLGRFGGVRPQTTQPPPDVREAEEQPAEKKVTTDQPASTEAVAVQPPLRATTAADEEPQPAPSNVLQAPAANFNNALQGEAAELSTVTQPIKLLEVKEIPEYERRAVLLWMLWQKRRAVPSSAEEKAQIDDDKRVLKEFLRSKQAMREIVPPPREARVVASPDNPAVAGPTSSASPVYADTASQPHGPAARSDKLDPG